MASFHVLGGTMRKLMIKAYHAIITCKIAVYIRLVLQARVDHEGAVRLVNKARICGCQVSLCTPWDIRTDYLA